MTNPTINLADHEAVERRVIQMKDQSRDVKSRLAPLLKGLWRPERELKIVDDLFVFDDLRERFPNFAEVLDYYQVNAIALHKVKQPFEAQPILLIGQPGLGKTLFSHALAKALTLPYFEIALSTVTASFALAGGSTQWEGGSPGFVATSLIESHFANPIMLIDELDKSNGGNRFNPMNAFYGLLERHTASRFKDEALGIEINASRINWIATANEIDCVPEAILSRVRVFTIEKPDHSSMRQVINSVYKSLREERAYGQLLSEHLPGNVIDSLIDYMPRGVRQILETAMLRAIRDDRSSLDIQDLTMLENGKKSYGFY